MKRSYIISGAVALGVSVGLFFVIKKLVQNIRERQGKISGEENAKQDPIEDVVKPPANETASIGNVQAGNIANQLYTLMNDCPYSTDSVAEFKTILNPIKNQSDWELIRNAYSSSREIDSCGWNMAQWGSHKGDLNSSIIWDYSSSELQEIKNWFNSKGIVSGL
jgi:hypothetical protein